MLAGTTVLATSATTFNEKLIIFALGSVQDLE